MAVVGGINALIGSNYLFIARKPDTASLLDVLPQWPWYIIHIEAIGLLSMLILYLPFAIRDLRDWWKWASRSWQRDGCPS